MAHKLNVSLAMLQRGDSIFLGESAFQPVQKEQFLQISIQVNKLYALDVSKVAIFATRPTTNYASSVLRACHYSTIHAILSAHSITSSPKMVGPLVN